MKAVKTSRNAGYPHFVAYAIYLDCLAGCRRNDPPTCTAPLSICLDRDADSPKDEQAGQ